MKLNSILLFFLLLALHSCNSNKVLPTSESQLKKQRSFDYHSFLAAENARVLGDTKKALSLYKEYARNNPNNATAAYNLARLQIQFMELNNAEKNAALATHLQPDNKYFHELYTNVLVINKKPKQAQLQYDALIKKYPNDNEYLYEKAVLQLVNRDYADAIESFNQLEKRMGFNEDIIIQRKNIYVKQGNTAMAVKEIEKLKKEDYSSPKYDLMIADLYENNGDSLAVAKTYKAVEANYAKDPMAQVALAQYYLEKKNKAKHDQYMQMAMRNKNLDVETKIALIIPVLRKLETDSLQRDNIIQLTKSIAEESENNKEAISLYADVLYFSRKYDDAIIAYRKYLALDNKKFATWSQLISIYSEQQKTDSVIDISKRCIEVFPENAVPYFYAGASYLQKRETEKAIEYLSKGLPLEKENKLLQSQFYASLGDAYNTQKKYTLSDSCFSKALDIQPADAGTLNNYAYYLSLRKVRLADAEKMSKTSLELQPDSKSFLDTYGWILFQQGNYKDALTYIKKALNAGGQDDGTLHEHIGDVYFKLADKENAIKSWKKAKELGEHNEILLKKIADGIYYES